jgi:hypothetical protein
MSLIARGQSWQRSIRTIRYRQLPLGSELAALGYLSCLADLVVSYRSGAVFEHAETARFRKFLLGGLMAGDKINLDIFGSRTIPVTIPIYCPYEIKPDAMPVVATFAMPRATPASLAALRIVPMVTWPGCAVAANEAHWAGASARARSSSCVSAQRSNPSSSP